jgi:hypothetical protein
MPVIPASRVPPLRGRTGKFSLIAALFLASGAPYSWEPEALAGTSPTYRYRRHRDGTGECPVRSRLWLHGECWIHVDLEAEKCSRDKGDDDEYTAPTESCTRLDKPSREVT